MGRRITTRIALLLFSTALVACSAEYRVPSGTKVAINFKEKTMLGYLFDLENPTSHAIFFRGTTWLRFAPNPTDTGFNCYDERTRVATIGGLPLFDGGKDPPPIEVPPGKAIKLWVAADAHQIKKGEACKLHLMLWRPDMEQPRGDVIESQSFQS